MTYPTVQPRRADALAELLRPLPESERVTRETDEEPWVVEASGGNYPRQVIDEASAAAFGTWTEELARLGNKVSESDRQALEARMAAELHRTLHDVEVAVLADMGFWRYLALFPYRWYLLAREPELQPQDFGGTAADPENPEKRHSKDPKYQLLLRTFLWGKAAFDPSGHPDPYERAAKVGQAGGAEIDVWHSHMIRTQLGHLGAIPHHFIDSICENPKACDTNKGRDVEKRLTRMKHNILLDVYGDDGRELVDEQKQIVLDALPKR